MELSGIKPDVKLLESITKEMAVQITALEVLAEEQAGENFNLKSPKQLGVLLFEKLGLPVIKRQRQVIRQMFLFWNNWKVRTL